MHLSSDFVLSSLPFILRYLFLVALIFVPLSCSASVHTALPPHRPNRITHAQVHSLRPFVFPLPRAFPYKHSHFLPYTHTHISHFVFATYKFSTFDVEGVVVFFRGSDLLKNLNPRCVQTDGVMAAATTSSNFANSGATAAPTSMISSQPPTVVTAPPPPPQGAPAQVVAPAQVCPSKKFPPPRSSSNLYNFRWFLKLSGTVICTIHTMRMLSTVPAPLRLGCWPPPLITTLSLLLYPLME